MQNISPIVMLIVLGSIWGAHFSLIKFLSNSGLNYSSLALYLCLGNAIILGLICKARGEVQNFSRSRFGYYIFCALFGYLFPLLLELNFVARLGAGVLSLVASTTPILTLAIALIVRSENFKFQKFIAVVIGFASVLPILLADFASKETGGAIVFCLAFSIPLCYAIYHNFVSKYWPSDTNSWQAAFGEAIACLIVVMPFYALNMNVGTSSLNYKFFTLIVALIIFSVLEIYLYFEIVRVSGAVFVSQASFLTVVTGVLWGVLLFDERHSAALWLSVLFLSLSIYLSAKNNDGTCTDG